MLIPRPMPTEHLEEFLNAVESRLGAAAVARDASACKQASTDYSWISPVLAPKVKDKVAEAVVFPPDSEGMATIARLAYAYDVPLVPRGKGTGNYGQAVPLDGGVVLDTSRMKQILSIEKGSLRAEAGVSFTKLEAAAAKSGQELAMFPSTLNSYLGGFLSGGSGGTGTVAHGFLWDGFVQSLKIVPCTETSTPFEVAHPQTKDHLHGYGVTGLIAEATIQLVPKTDWQAVFASFPADHWKVAAYAGLQIMDCAVRPRLVSLDQAELTELYPDHPGIFPGRLSMRVLAAPEALDGYRASIEAAGGRIDLVDPKACMFHTMLSYNHVTLRAIQADPAYCHLMMGGPAAIEKAEEVCSVLPDSMLHLDGMRIGGKGHFGGLLISKFVSDSHLYAGMRKLREIGLGVADPHTWFLGLGHYPSADLVARVSAEVDPKGLLNPGRLPTEAQVAAYNSL